MSGLNSSADEITPLLSNNNIKWEALLPSVSETIILDDDGDSLDIIDFKHSFRSRQTTPIPVIAFEFLVVLYHLTLRDTNSKDVYYESRKTIPKVKLKKKALTLFDEISQTFKNNSGMETALSTLLVYRFRLDPAGSKYLCVLDLLDHDEIPPELFTDSFLTRFITRLWQSGWTATQEYSFTTSRIHKLDNILRAPRK
ncbi:hypothetical protein Clacol_003844 [Clathrus columnatus]|uniref:Uncharacterized protein n=1 Tax=Clathrus columnatus TaxID=1419009 RepID=A0AAV5AAT9_9AGAM|nr:hypothetical protein Clacol_003844 [Clathrus columnatus]